MTEDREPYYGCAQTPTDSLHNPKSPLEELREIFTYHPPQPYQLALYSAIRTGALVFAEQINNSCPECADKHAAIRKVREAVMTANAAIALVGRI